MRNAPKSNTTKQGSRPSLGHVQSRRPLPEAPIANPSQSKSVKALAVIEAPKGRPHTSTSTDEGLDRVVFDRFLSGSHVYPTELTLPAGHLGGGDGDPDRLLVGRARSPDVPGCVTSTPVKTGPPSSGMRRREKGARRKRDSGTGSRDPRWSPIEKPSTGPCPGSCRKHRALFNVFYTKTSKNQSGSRTDRVATPSCRRPNGGDRRRARRRELRGEVRVAPGPPQRAPPRRSSTPAPHLFERSGFLGHLTVPRRRPRRKNQPITGSDTHMSAQTGRRGVRKHMGRKRAPPASGIWRWQNWTPAGRWSMGKWRGGGRRR